MNTRLLHGAAGARELRDRWVRLRADCAPDDPFLDWEFMVCWMEHFGATGSAQFLLIEDDGGATLGIVPMRSGAKLTLLGDPHCADYLGFLAARGRARDAAAALAEHLLARSDWSIASFGPAPEGGCLEPLAEACQEAGLYPVVETASVSPFVRVPEPGAEFDGGLSKSLRRDLRAARRRFESEGGWSFERVSPGSDWKSAMDRLVSLHLKRQGAKAGRSVFEDPRHLEFYRTALPERFKFLELGELRVGGRTVAAALSLKTPGAYRLWIPAVDPALAKVSPGKLLIEQAIRSAFADGARIFDFMGGDEPYKLQWTAESWRNIRVVVYRRAADAALRRVGQGAKSRLRDIVRRSSVLTAVRRLASKGISA